MQCERYSTFAKSWHRTPHGSFLLRAIFFGQSAETSASKSATLPSPALLDQSYDPISTGACTRCAIDPKSAELAL